VTEPPASSSFATRCLRLAGDAGWRVALHALPYAVACGVITEGMLRLRLAVLWKLPLVTLTLASLYLAVLLGTHVSTLRLAGRSGLVLAPTRHVLGTTARISGESAVAALVGLLAALALVGALDIGIAMLAPAGGARWPETLLRAIATLAALAGLIVILTAGTALAASTLGRVESFATAARQLFRRSERTTAVVCTAIFAGTAVAIVATRLLGMADLGPPIIAAALAKAAGFLALTIPLSVGAAVIAAEA
jgi:hypothetical protein